MHGFADYFFQTPAADFWIERGYDFYALDLRKYGRSLRDHQTPELRHRPHDYYAELDEAYRLITERDGHDHVVVSAHSTGGLITPLWVHDRQPAVAALVLNSPWLDLQGSLLLRTAGTKAIDQIGARQPLPGDPPRRVRLLRPQPAPRPRRRVGLRPGAGSRWSPGRCTPAGCAPYAGGTRGRTAGSTSPAPVLVLTSRASGHPKEYDETCSSTDIVLDVELIRKWAHRLAGHVTLVRVEGALHDVTLSREPVRKRAFDEIGRWLDAYVG